MISGRFIGWKYYLCFALRISTETIVCTLLDTFTVYRYVSENILFLVSLKYERLKYRAGEEGKELYILTVSKICFVLVYHVHARKNLDFDYIEIRLSNPFVCMQEENKTVS